MGGKHLWRLDGASLDQADDHLSGREAHRIARRADASQRRLDERSPFEVVVRDNRELAWHVDAVLPEAANHRDCQRIAGRHGGRHAPVDEYPDSLADTLGLSLADVEGQDAVWSDTGFDTRAAVRFNLVARRLKGQVFRDQGDLAVPVLPKVA